MAKVSVPCETCGGSYEDTPSGRSKHNGTGKHVAAATALGMKNAAKAKAKGGPVKAGKPVLVGESGPETAELPGEVITNREADEPQFHVVATETAEDAPSGPDLTIAANDPFTALNLPAYVNAVAEAAKARVALDDAKQAVAKYKRYVRYGELHSQKNLPKYQSQLAEAEATFAAAEEQSAAAEAEEQSQALVAREAKDAYWLRVHRATVAAIRAELPKALDDFTVLSTLGGLTVGVGALPVSVIGPHRGLEDGEVTVVTSKVMVKVDALVHPNLALQISQRIFIAARYAAALDKVTGLSNKK